MGFPIEAELKIDTPIRVQIAGAVPVDETGGGQSAVGTRAPLSPAPVPLTTGRWSRWIAIAGGFGYVPVAPGTAGSFAGVLLFGLMAVAGAGMGLAGLGFFGFYASSVVVILLVGIYAAGRAEIDFGRRDDGRIVIDEVVGQLIALAPLMPLALWVAQSAADPTIRSTIPSTASSFDMVLFSFELVTGFVLFRLFDVWKPGAVGWTERRLGGGLGVMADDVVAGLYAATGLFALHAVLFERFYSSRVIWPTWLTSALPLGLGSGLSDGVSAGLSAGLRVLS